MGLSSKIAAVERGMRLSDADKARDRTRHHQQMQWMCESIVDDEPAYAMVERRDCPTEEAYLDIRELVASAQQRYDEVDRIGPLLHRIREPRYAHLEGEERAKAAFTDMTCRNAVEAALAEARKRLGMPGKVERDGYVPLEEA